MEDNQNPGSTPNTDSTVERQAPEPTQRAGGGGAPRSGPGGARSARHRQAMQKKRPILGDHIEQARSRARVALRTGRIGRCHVSHRRAHAWIIRTFQRPVALSSMPDTCRCQ